MTFLSPCRDRSVESSASFEAFAAKMEARMEALVDQVQDAVKTMKTTSEGVESGASSVVAAPAPALKPSLGQNCSVINAADLLYVGHGDSGPYSSLNYRDYAALTSGRRSSQSKAKKVFNALINVGGFDPTGFSDLRAAERTDRVTAALRSLKNSKSLNYVVHNTLMVSTVYGHLLEAEARAKE